jgi:hypothetical protein
MHRLHRLLRTMHMLRCKIWTLLMHKHLLRHSLLLALPWFRLLLSHLRLLPLLHAHLFTLLLRSGQVS